MRDYETRLRIVSEAFRRLLDMYDDAAEVDPSSPAPAWVTAALLAAHDEAAPTISALRPAPPPASTDDPEPCEACDGGGEIVVDASTPNEMAQDTADCEECGGSGRAPKHPRSCNRHDNCAESDAVVSEEVRQRPHRHCHDPRCPRCFEPFDADGRCNHCGEPGVGWRCVNPECQSRTEG